MNPRPVVATAITSVMSGVRIGDCVSTKDRPEDSASSLFGLEIMVPAQFFNRAGGKTIQSGEMGLMLAVLEEAVTTFQRHLHDDTARGRRLFSEANEWLHSTDGISWPFAFEAVCNTLAIDPEYLRRGLAVWKKAQRRSGEALRYRSPFRRVSARRSSISLRQSGLRKSA
jgi:hypothetical protein